MLSILFPKHESGFFFDDLYEANDRSGGGGYEAGRAAKWFPVSRSVCKFEEYPCEAFEGNSRTRITPRARTLKASGPRTIRYLHFCGQLARWPPSVRVCVTEQKTRERKTWQRLKRVEAFVFLLRLKRGWRFESRDENCFSDRETTVSFSLFSLLLFFWQLNFDMWRLVHVKCFSKL